MESPFLSALEPPLDLPLAFFSSLLFSLESLSFFTSILSFFLSSLPYFLPGLVSGLLISTSATSITTFWILIMESAFATMSSFVEFSFNASLFLFGHGFS